MDGDFEPWRSPAQESFYGFAGLIFTVAAGVLLLGLVTFTALFGDRDTPLILSPAPEVAGEFGAPGSGSAPDTIPRLEPGDEALLSAETTLLPSEILGLEDGVQELPKKSRQPATARASRPTN